MIADRLRIVLVGHVDHGKSTVLGRMLFEAGAVAADRMAAVKLICDQQGRDFEYAYLLDALKEERSQGITIDAARAVLRRSSREYYFYDAPGHADFLKNLLTGASQAQAAVLVIDAQEGLQENSRRHAYLLSLLDIHSLIVLVNKLDTVDYNEAVFNAAAAATRTMLAACGIALSVIIPTSAACGDNIAAASAKTPWYTGPTFLQALEALPGAALLTEAPTRFFVQDVYRQEESVSSRIVAGSVMTGMVRPGQKVVFYPSGRQSHVASVEQFDGQQTVHIDAAGAGTAVGLTLADRIYVTRGELLAVAAEPPPAVAKAAKATLFWLSKTPLQCYKDYLLKCGTARVGCRLEQIVNHVDSGGQPTAEERSELAELETAEVLLSFSKPLAFDLRSLPGSSSRFVIVDNFAQSGGGVFTAAVDDSLTPLQQKKRQRESRWQRSLIAAPHRAERYGQKATLVLVTGSAASDREGFAKLLEAKLFADGRIVYFLGMGSLLYGLDADIRGTVVGTEHMRRIGELANMFLDAGLMLIVSARALQESDVAVIRTVLQSDKVVTVWLGSPTESDLTPDVLISNEQEFADGVEAVKAVLTERGALYRPW